MRLYFTSSASTEFEDAVDHFDDRQTGLGAEFRQEVERAANRIAVDPTKFTALRHGNENLPHASISIRSHLSSG